jgi:uncharacterized phage protein gp47/JayE
MTTGLTALGFVTKPLLDIKTDLEDAFRLLGIEKLDPASVAGQKIGIISERLSELWDACEALDAAFDPDEATGQALDSLCAMTGTSRHAATHSPVTLTLGGDAGTVVALGKQVSNKTTGVKFETLAEATFNSTPATVDGISCAGTASVAAQSVDTGPLVGLTGYLTVIETPVSGWLAVTNAADADPGQDVETDADLRLRREVELHTAATAALEAIREALLDLDTTPAVSGAVVFENCTMVTDGEGLPPKSVRAVVNGGAAADIRASLFATVAAGIETDGTTSGTVTDTQGVTHTIKYTVGTPKNVYQILNVTKDALNYPTDGDAQILAAVLAYGDTLVMGKNVVSGAIASHVFPIEGVLEVECLIGLSNPPTTDTTIPIDIDEIGVFDSSRTTINSSDGTP